MKKTMKRGLALGLSLMLGITGNMTIQRNFPDRTMVIEASDKENINNGKNDSKDVPFKIFGLTPYSAEDDADPDVPTDTTPAAHFYEDYNYTKSATNSTILVYANGGTVTVPGSTEKTNYKSSILYTDINASYIYTVDKKGVVKPSTGKVIVGITSSNEKPDTAKGRIVDKEAAKVASASIKGGQITVTAKTQPGKVYLWAIDTGRNAEAACIPVTVKIAPAATNIYAVPDTDESFLYGKTKQFKSEKINVGESVNVYLYPTYKLDGTVKKMKNASYTAAVDAKMAEYFSVERSSSDPLCFVVKAKGLKDGKSVSGNITFTCDLNGKKTTFKATATNQVTSISTGNVSGLTGSGNAFGITASNSEKITGTFEIETKCVSNAEGTTDSLKFYAMGSADGYDAAKLETGTVKITQPKNAAQGKISMKLEKDKKTVTVTAAKGTEPVTAYFLAVYNTNKGYTVFSVTAQ